MMKMHRKTLFGTWLLAAASLAASPAWSAAAVGESLPPIALKDQLGTAHTLDASVRRIYANADRKGDGLMKAAKIEQKQLDAQKAIVVADISEAPGFVKSIIKSSLKDRRYTTWLDLSGSTQKVLPYKTDQVTVIELNQQKITAIRYLPDTESLKRELAPALKQP